MTKQKKHLRTWIYRLYSKINTVKISFLTRTRSFCVRSGSVRWRSSFTVLIILKKLDFWLTVFVRIELKLERWTMKDKRLTMNDEQRTMNRERWTENDERWKMNNERQRTVRERRTQKERVRVKNDIFTVFILLFNWYIWFGF